MCVAQNTYRLALFVPHHLMALHDVPSIGAERWCGRKSAFQRGLQRVTQSRCSQERSISLPFHTHSFPLLHTLLQVGGVLLPKQDCTPTEKSFDRGLRPCCALYRCAVFQKYSGRPPGTPQTPASQTRTQSWDGKEDDIEGGVDT